MENRPYNVKEIILDIVHTVIPEADLGGIVDDVRLRDQVDLDSMDFLDIVMELRKRYKIDVPKKDYPCLSTINSCREYLEPILSRLG